ncbi:MAG: hypothetical protein CL933_24565 [Deltaproteobacteria bacterium]|nr:hypothetical protein [Deltaproteobacteria bacterium]
MGPGGGIAPTSSRLAALGSSGRCRGGCPLSARIQRGLRLAHRSNPFAGFLERGCLMALDSGSNRLFNR